MGLFGSTRKKNPWDLAGAWDQFDPSTQGTPQFPQEAPPTAPTQRQSWMEGGKFTARDGIGMALASVGDIFAQRGGGQATAMPMLMHGRQEALDAQRAAQAAQLKHQQDREDFLWEQEHRAPPPNDTERDLQLIEQRYGKAAADQWMQNRIDPIVNVPMAGGATYMGPRSGMAGALGGGQQAAPGALTPGTIHDGYRYKGGDPKDQNSWEPVGGGAGNGVGGFHVPSGSPLYRR